MGQISQDITIFRNLTDQLVRDLKEQIYVSWPNSSSSDTQAHTKLLESSERRTTGLPRMASAGEDANRFHVYQSLSCANAIDTKCSDLLSLKRVYVKYKNDILSHIGSSFRT